MKAKFNVGDKVRLVDVDARYFMGTYSDNLVTVDEVLTISAIEERTAEVIYGFVEDVNNKGTPDWCNIEIKTLRCFVND